MKGMSVISSDELVIELNGEHCIETTASKIHRILMGQYLEGRVQGQEAEGTLDTLARFLAQTDFRSLRAGYPELAGGTRARIRLYRSKSGKVLWERLTAE